MEITVDGKRYFAPGDNVWCFQYNIIVQRRVVEVNDRGSIIGETTSRWREWYDPADVFATLAEAEAELARRKAGE